MTKKRCAKCERLQKLVDLLLDYLKDIKDHSGMPGYVGPRWSNYCHYYSSGALNAAKVLLEGVEKTEVKP